MLAVNVVVAGIERVISFELNRDGDSVYVLFNGASQNEMDFLLEHGHVAANTLLKELFIGMAMQRTRIRFFILANKIVCHELVVSWNGFEARMINISQDVDEAVRKNISRARETKLSWLSMRASIAGIRKGMATFMEMD